LDPFDQPTASSEDNVALHSTHSLPTVLCETTGIFKLAPTSWASSIMELRLPPFGRLGTESMFELLSLLVSDTLLLGFGFLFKVFFYGGTVIINKCYLENQGEQTSEH
jgi:hypothetical protein